MPNHCTAVNVHSFTRITPAPQLPDASDSVPTMRRELKQLRIELERLRAMEKLHSAVIDRITDSRDQWQREAERLSALMVQMRSAPPRYFFDSVPYATIVLP